MDILAYIVTILFVIVLIIKNKIKKNCSKFNKKYNLFFITLIIFNIATLCLVLLGFLEGFESIENHFLSFGIITLIFNLLFLITYKKFLISFVPEEKHFILKLPHLIGLSFPEDTYCELFLDNKFLKIKANNVEYSLDLIKIKNISIKSSTEIQTQYVSSVGGAVTGALLFGSLGAIIGGRAKKKNVQKITSCLIVTYLKDNNIDYLAFNIPNITLEIKAKKFINYFKTNNKNIEETKINL